MDVEWARGMEDAEDWELEDAFTDLRPSGRDLCIGGADELISCAREDDLVCMDRGSGSSVSSDSAFAKCRRLFGFGLDCSFFRFLEGWDIFFFCFVPFCCESSIKVLEF
jgi:hypothetical protein